VANANNHTKNWFNQNRNFVFAFLAFAVPLLIRAIPEVLMGQYVVGFDTIGYYIPGTFEWLKTGIDFWAFFSDAPLLYILTIGVASVGGSITLLIKIMSPLLLGLLGISVYSYANKALKWSSKKSLIVAMLSTLYFIALRVSWDMLRSELGLVFLFVGLILLQKSGRSTKDGILLALSTVLLVFSNQLVAVIMFAILVARIARLYLDMNKNKVVLIKTILSVVPAAILFSIIVYFNYFVYSLPSIGLSVKYSGAFSALATASHSDLIVNTLGFLAFCYLPLLPFILFGARRLTSSLELKAWIAWIFIPLILVIASPNAFFIGGILPYRWILLLTYPLSFFAVEGIAAIKWNWYKIAVGFILALLSVTFLIMPNSSTLKYYTYYPTYMPKSMLQNTVQLSDCQDTSKAVLWAKENMPSNAYLLAHEAFYGWAALVIDVNRLILYGYGNPTEVAQEHNSSSNPLYLVWWVNGTGWYGQPTIEGPFQEVYHSGNIAIFKYAVNNSQNSTLAYNCSTFKDGD
jgi:hypothetical protein